jgi:hypothetical protein
LTVSVFDALFSGKKELFEGLYAEKFFERTEYRPHSVICLDMSDLTTNMGIGELRVSMLERVEENAKRLGVAIGSEVGIATEAGRPGDAFSILMRGTAEKYGINAVLLVDEYDKPVLDCLNNDLNGDLKKNEAVRDVLKDFYGRTKAADRYLRFVFMTGISKFSKVGILSALNNLKDISMKEEYAAMLGYTEEELLSDFDGHIEKTVAALKEPKEELVGRIRNYYDGFSFDGKNRLYNPFSVLNFFDAAKFKNYWFESGTPSFLAENVRRRDLEAESFRGPETDDEFTSAAEIERSSPESFLFQSGYLSIREAKGRKLILDYPNMEVLSSVAKLFLRDKFGIIHAEPAALDVEEAIGRGDVEKVITTYNSLLAALPYDIYERERPKYAEERKKGERYVLRYAESFYHALLFALFWSARIRTTAENHSYRGRSDIELEKDGHRYIFELKTANGKNAAEKATEAAKAQIRHKGYADKYVNKRRTLVGLVVDQSTRRVEACRIQHGNA